MSIMFANHFYFEILFKVVGVDEDSYKCLEPHFRCSSELHEFLDSNSFLGCFTVQHPQHAAPRWPENIVQRTHNRLLFILLAPADPANK